LLAKWVYRLILYNEFKHNILAFIDKANKHPTKGGKKEQIKSGPKSEQEKHGITNLLALPINKMLYIYPLCPHFEHQKNPFQSKHFDQRNQFT
jgi:hypothetical protein